MERSYDRAVTPVVAALLGVLAGLFVGVVASYLLRPPSAAPEPLDPMPERRQVLDLLHSAGALVGGRDEVLAANALASDYGVVRGDRVAIPALLDLVREVRVSGETEVINLDQTRSGRPEQRLGVRVTRLPDGVVLVIADDRAAALRVQASARDFMANATHELKTPVGAITLLAEAAEQASEAPDAVVRFSRKIQAESNRLSQLVTQIVQLSRLQGDPTRSWDSVDVDQVVSLAIDRSRQLAEQRQISLTTGGVAGLVVRGNLDQLVTAVTNLLHNGITYSDPKTRVVVTTRALADAEGDHVAIAVSDNGIGISEDDQARVFERFYRVDYARSRQTGGTGLGLSIVAEIVEGHGGEVSLWSKPGSGSTFTITLPAGQTEEDNA